MIETFDAIIVGGGPAGSTCAWKLRQAGMSVLVLDKKPFPRVKPCAGWITPQVVESLAMDVDDYRVSRTWQPITGFRCGIIGGKELEVGYGRMVSYGIRRYEFDDYLLRRCGGRLALNESAESIERIDGEWVINGQYQSPLLIGAGGHFCPVARRFGARREAASVVYAQEIEYEADSRSSGNVTGDAPALYFCRDLSGYGWVFRKGNYLNVGLGRLDAKKLSTHVAEFGDFLWDRGIVKGERPKHWLGHAYQLYEHVAPVLTADSALLIGDSAGLSYPQSGEGIRPAIESALIAAETIVRAKGNYQRADLAGYETALTARLGTPRTRGLSWLPQAWLHFVARGLLARRWFCQSVVMNKWFLHADQAALFMNPA